MYCLEAINLGPSVGRTPIFRRAVSVIPALPKSILLLPRSQLYLWDSPFPFFFSFWGGGGGGGVWGQGVCVRFLRI